MKAGESDEAEDATFEAEMVANARVNEAAEVPESITSSEPPGTGSGGDSPKE
jgi:hypothetical protein